MTLLSKILHEKDKIMRQPLGAVYKIRFNAVYQYRNRWVLGTIEGKLDTFSRKFTQNGKKKGIQSIKCKDDAFRIRKHVKDFMALSDFLATNIAVRGKDGDFASSTPVQKEAKYLERLVLKGCNVKRMWVDPFSVIL